MKKKLQNIIFRLLLVIIGIILCISGFCISVEYMKTLSGDVAGMALMVVGVSVIFAGIFDYYDI